MSSDALYGRYNPIGSPNDVATLNADEKKYRDSALQGAQSAASSFSDWMNRLSGKLNNGNLGVSYTNAAAQQVNAPGAVNAQQVSSAYDPNAATNAFLALNPALQDLAHQQASAALSPTRQSAQQLADLTSQQAVRSTSDQLAKAGLLNSGAANQALLEANLAPQQQMQTQLAQMQAQLEGQNYNNLLGLTGGQLQSGYGQAGQQAFQAGAMNASNALQAALANAQNQLSAGTTNAQLGTQVGLANAANQMNAQQQSIANMLSGYGLLGQLGGTQANIYDTLAQLTQQQYWQPQYARTPGLMDWLSLGIQGIGAMNGGGGGGSTKNSGPIVSTLLGG